MQCDLLNQIDLTCKDEDIGQSKTPELPISIWSFQISALQTFIVQL